MDRFTKVSDSGLLLAATEPEWVAVLDTRTNLMWPVAETRRMTYAKALEYPKKLATAGFEDWRLPTVEELFLLADRTRYSPAIDTAFFQKAKSDWYWSSTVDASSPSDYAWLVGFSHGYSSWYDQSHEGFVRAVRSSQ